MAERVQRHLELMVDEIEEMQRVQLYTRNETKMILKRRKEFEYKINGVTKNLKDYQDYIQFELLLVKQIRTRRKLSKIRDRKRSIEYKILRRIKKLYEIAVDRFSGDFPLHLAFFKFCKEYDFTIPGSILTEHMIQRFPNVPEVWQIAASWFALERNDVKRSLSIIHKGLSLHKNNKMLYKEAIKLELYQMNNNKKDDEHIAKLQSIVLKKLQAYIMVILQTMDDCEFIVEILDLLQEYSFTVELQNEIIAKLLSDYADKAVVWNALALREKTNDPTAVQACCNKFEEGLLQVSDRETAELWQNYLDFLQQYRRVGDCEKLLKHTLERAANNQALPERFYILWLELVTDEEAPKILKLATESSPKLSNLWKLRLKLEILRNDNDSTIQQVFDDGVKNLGGESLELWLMFLDYHKNNVGIAEALFQRAIQQNSEISTILKGRYIEWLVINKNIEEARHVYKIIANERPYSKDLHLIMAKLEEQQSEVSLNDLSFINQLACTQFGEECIDVWINSILLHLNHNNSDDVNDVVQRIYREALNALSRKPMLLSEFKEKYQLALAGEIQN